MAIIDLNKNPARLLMHIESTRARDREFAIFSFQSKRRITVLFKVYGTRETRTLESREIQNERCDFPLERGGRCVQLEEESNIG